MHSPPRPRSQWQLAFLGACTLGMVRMAAAGLEDAASFDYALADVSTNLVRIRCEFRELKRDGCGFVAMMDGKPYLVANQYLLLGAERIKFTSPCGRAIQPQGVEVGANGDLVRLPLADGGGFALASGCGMGEAVAVFGKDEAKEAKDSIYGRISGIGADRIEVTAEFDTANMGCPVLNTRREVVALASYTRESRSDAVKKGSRFDHGTRRFCLKLEGIQWQPVDWKRFNHDVGTPYLEASLMLDRIGDLLEGWREKPLGQVQFGAQPDRELASWAQSHNDIVGQAVDVGKGRREFYDSYSSSMRRLSAMCSAQARQLRRLSEQRGLTAYLAGEIRDQADALEAAAALIDRMGSSTY